MASIFWSFWSAKEECEDTRRPLKFDNSLENCSCSNDWWLKRYFENNFNLDTRRKDCLPKYHNMVFIGKNHLHQHGYWRRVSLHSLPVNSGLGSVLLKFSDLFEPLCSKFCYAVLRINIENTR